MIDAKTSRLRRYRVYPAGLVFGSCLGRVTTLFVFNKSYALCPFGFPMITSETKVERLSVKIVKLSIDNHIVGLVHTHHIAK